MGDDPFKNVTCKQSITVSLLISVYKFALYCGIGNLHLVCNRVFSKGMGSIDYGKEDSVTALNEVGAR